MIYLDIPLSSSFHLTTEQYSFLIYIWTLERPFYIQSFQRLTPDIQRWSDYLYG